MSIPRFMNNIKKRLSDSKLFYFILFSAKRATRVENWHVMEKTRGWKTKWMTQELMSPKKFWLGIFCHRLFSLFLSLQFRWKCDTSLNLSLEKVSQLFAWISNVRPSLSQTQGHQICRSKFFNLIKIRRSTDFVSLRPRLHEQIKPLFMAQILDP